MKLPRWGSAVMIALLLIIVAVAGTRFQKPMASQRIACVDPVSGCTFEHRGQAVQLRFLQSPQTLQAFGMTVHAPHARRIHAEFQMQGMEMGPNRYALTEAQAGVFIAQIQLPVCVSGRRDWHLYLHIDGQTYAIPFRTS